MNINSLLNNALVFDIETSALDSKGREISIRTQHGLYLELAQVKWFGCYSFKDKKEYYLEASKDRQKICGLLEKHSVYIGFNSEEFDFPILQNNGFIRPGKYINHIDCMKILGASSFKDKNGYPFKGRGELMEYKFKKNSLQCMAETMKLEFQKSTIDYKIFHKNTYTEEERKEVIKYLKNDVMATKGLFDKLWEYWIPFIDLLDWKYVENFSWLKSSIASLIYKSACYSINTEPTYSEKKGKTEEMGGRVLLPKYEEVENVWYVDFASLYPHIFCMFNLFAETENKEKGWHGNNLFKVKGYYDISYKHPLVKVVEEKLKQRMELKKNDPKNPMTYTIKIFLNGLYGVVRSSIFEKVHTPNAGWDCCLLGQQIQKFAQDELEKYGFEAVYGDTDSVPKDTPILIKYRDKIELIPIEDLFNAPKTNTLSKLNIEHKNIKILTDNGWSNIKYIYRHKTRKKMYRIATRKGFIEVSEDHSLVIDGKSISPAKLQVGDNLELIDYDLPNETTIDKDLCWLIGFWLAEGTTGYYEYKNGIKYAWALNQKKIEPLQKSQKILEKYGLYTKILNTLKSSNCNKLVPYGNIKLFYELFSEWCLSKTGYKKIPSFILTANKESKKAFLKGYLKGDGHIDKKDGSINFGSIDKPLFDGLCKIFESLGEDYTIKIRKDKTNFLAGRIILNKNSKNLNSPNKILKIETYKNYDNIYDIETENHHFCGGIGNVNLHNSLMVVSKSKKHLDRDYIKICLKKIIQKIFDNVPFPVETFKIDIENFLQYMLFPFSEQPIVDEETGKNLKKGNRLVKERKGKKKNYCYLYEKDNELKIKLVGLPIIKDNATPLGMKIFNEVLKPKILEQKRAKFTHEFIDQIIEEYLKNKEIMKLLAVEFKVKPFKTYKKEGQIQAQISKHYFGEGEGVISLIKNNKIGKVGKGNKYCTMEEGIENNLTAKDIELEKVHNELQPFVLQNLTITK